MDNSWTTKLVDKYLVVNKRLGSGSFGIVYHALMKENYNHHLAAKTILSKSLKKNKRFVECLTREIKILQSVQHPNIVKLYDVSRTDNYIYIFLELCNDGDLATFMKNRPHKRLSEIDAVGFFKQIAEGFKALQALKVMHRDIKPTNILLKEGVAKISDFGFARSIESGMEDPSFYSRVGTPLYMSPQILEGLPFSSKCDIWSLGIMLYEMLYGFTPYDGENPFTILKNIKANPLNFPDKPVRSQVIKSLIRSMLEVNEKDRISWEGIFEHEVMVMDPQQMKMNEKGIASNDLEASAEMNALYNRQNLVQGYIRQPVELKEEQFENMLDSDLQFGGPVVEDQLIGQIEAQQRRQRHFAKFSQYFHYERNIAFMFNFVIQKLYKLMSEQALKIPKVKYYRTLYCLSKNQNIHLMKLTLLLQNKNQEIFEKDMWGKYMASKDYDRIHTMIQLDLKYTRSFFESILEKAKAEDFETDTNLTPDPAFQAVYLNEVEEIIKALVSEVEDKSSSKLPYYRDKLEMVFFLNVCRNPYSEFSDPNTDFNTFYENLYSSTEKELAQRINQQLIKQ